MGMGSNGDDILSRKRLRLEDCVICSRVSYDGIQKAKRDEYVKILLSNFQPPSKRKLDDFASFEFCIDCIPILEDLLQLKIGLDFILTNIKSKIQEIQFIILKNDPRSSNNKIQSFRKFAVRAFCPRVEMHKNNTLGHIEKKADEEIQEISLLDSPIESPEIEVIENLDKGPNSVGPSDTDLNEYTSPLSNREEAVSPPPITYTMTNKTYSNNSDDVTGVPIAPKPFNYVTPESTSSVVGEPSAKNIEDFVTIVTEPPKFVSAQSNIYFEKYRDMYKCKFCSTILKAEANMSTLARHINIIHSINNRFKCAVCLAVFFSRSKCLSHLSECHFEMFRRKPTKKKSSQTFPPEKSHHNDNSQNCRTTGNNNNDNNNQTNNNFGMNASTTSSTSSVQHQFLSNSTSSTHFTGGSLFHSVSRKKTTPTTISHRNRSSSGSETERSTSGLGTSKYSNDKITSAEVMIEIEQKGNFNFEEEENVVKFEPWEKESSNATEYNTFDPLAETAFVTVPTVPTTTAPPPNEKTYELINLEDDKSEDSSEEFTVNDQSVENSIKHFKKPFLSMKQLIVLAMSMAENEFMCLNVGSICKFIKVNFPFYKKMDNLLPLNRKVRQALNFRYNGYPIFATKGTDERGRLLYSVVNDAPGSREKIVRALRNSKSAPTIAFPGKLEAFCSNLLRRRTQIESEMTEVETTSNPTNEWMRPPFTIVQLIFIAIKNISPVAITCGEMIRFMEETFPYFKYVAKRRSGWTNGIYAALNAHSGKMFQRCTLTHEEHSVERPRHARYAWAISDKAPISSIKEDIKRAISSSPLLIVESTVNPEIVFKNTLDNDYQSSLALMTPIQSGRRLNADKSQNSKKPNSESVSESIADLPTSVVKEDEITIQEMLRTAPTPGTPEVTVLEKEHGRASQNKIKWNRPVLTYPLLAAVAIANSMNKSLNCESVCDFIMQTFPYYKTLEENWRYCIYRALSTHQYFTWTFQGGVPYSLFALNNITLPDLRSELVQTLRGCVIEIYLSMANSDQFDSIFGMLLHPDYDFLPYARRRIREYQQTIPGQPPRPIPTVLSQSVPEGQPDMPLTFFIIPPVITTSINVNPYPTNSI